MSQLFTRRTLLMASLWTGLAALSWGGHRRAEAHSGKIINLKDLEDDHVIKSISYCSGTYTVTTLTGKSRTFPEFNLRIKTDSGPNGPNPGKPVLIQSGMRGDRSFVIFRSPSELQKYTLQGCKEKRS